MSVRRAVRLLANEVLVIATVSLVAFGLGACGGGGGADTTAPPATRPVASVSVSAGANSLVAGATTQLTATMRDASGNVLSGRTVSWSTDAGSVATVSSAGLVTGVSPGTATMHATSEGVAGSISITVTPPPVATVTVALSGSTLEAGATLQLTATTQDAQGGALTGRAIAWSSSATAVATVSASGLVSALTPGTVQIQALSEGVSGTASLTVTAAAVATVTLSRDTATLVPNQPLTLAATLKDIRGAVLTGRNVTWSSSAASVVGVASTTGVLTVLTPGVSTITATIEAKTAQAAITVLDGGWVTPAVSAVNAASGHVAMAVGAGAVATGLAITVAPIAVPPSDPRLVASTSYTFGPIATTFAQPIAVSIVYDAANVGSAVASNFRLHRFTNGAWTPVGGSTVNTATRVVTGNVSALGQYAILEVVPPVATITLTPASSDINVGETVSLTATLRDANNNVLTSRAIAWSSNNTAVATVSSAGVVTGVANGGPITITATSEGQTATAQVSVHFVFALASMSLGYQHSCGLTPQGAAYCWGSNFSDQLGVGTQAYFQTTPIAVRGGLVFAQLSAGGNFNCALTAAGVAWCWGLNSDGQLGDGSNVIRDVPVPVTGGFTFTKLAAGFDHTCGLSVGGVARCWGRGQLGAIGAGDFAQHPTPTLVSGGLAFTDIASGFDFTCGLTAAGAAWCWGFNRDNTLGDSSVTNRNVPVLVTGGHTFDAIYAGSIHACGHMTDGELWCWGNGNLGALGDSAFQQRSAPVRVYGAADFGAVGLSGETSCALRTGGVATCWGTNSSGQAADGTTVTRNIPTAVVGGLVFTKLASGHGEHLCALTAAGVPWCWGWNIQSELGDGTATNRLTPVQVQPPSSAVSAARTSTQRKAGRGKSM